MEPVPAGIALLYTLVIIVGVAGNAWVVLSVVRSRRPRSKTTPASPSDRLRSYIAVLAVVDLTALMALFVRTLYLVLPELRLDNVSCQAVFLLDHTVKLASLTCLSCISVERYITIRKPFCSSIRKRFIQLTPVIAICALTVFSAALLLEMNNVVVSSDGLNCVQSTKKKVWMEISGQVVAASFIAQLMMITNNYSQIVRHVRRKFSKRKARVVAHSRQHESLVSEPRYMREMTSAILRVLLFHVVCWLPFCALRLVPVGDSISQLSASIRMFRNFTDYSLVSIGVFFAHILTYLSATGDWIFYAVMNRDLRNLIRLTTERRKRSTLSQQCSPSPLHKSLRQQVTSSLRFFQSIQSYRSSGAGCSFDDSTYGHSLVIQQGHGGESPKSSIFSNDFVPSPKISAISKYRTSLLNSDEVAV
ncbi:hypothetical protein PFISCL1PPCAC_7730 [Pristionchus fissidentatus]|uniref:G-protein coupled receptors family 1 profile domain-containing protein n=1 Tax=Pristionchus fissidentatus TaxID=1538716 RepID=A0AAV5VDZ2_9BILA|nr:hypothetical protein PFISCL1PPCAC_7730 [Pristionchus fissidentatus]